MAQVFGKRSKYLIKNDRKYRNIAAILLLFYFVFTIFYFINTYKNPHGFLTSIFLIITTAFLVLIIIIRLIIAKSINISDNYYQGRKGEYKIYYKLLRLSDDFLVFQDIQPKDRLGNIDFVVVGPTGIYSIEVKSHKGKITFDGNELLRNGTRIEEKDILSQTFWNAMKIHDYIKDNLNKNIFVEPVLIFSSRWASMRFGLKKIKNVYVIQKEFLKELMLKGSVVLSQEDISILKDELKKVVKIKN